MLVFLRQTLKKYADNLIGLVFITVLIAFVFASLFKGTFQDNSIWAAILTVVAKILNGLANLIWWLVVIIGLVESHRGARRRLQTIIMSVLALALVLCLLDMSYGYYLVVKYVAMVGFGSLALLSNEQGERNETIGFVCLAILYQPIFSISLDSKLWVMIDVFAVGCLFLLAIRMTPDRK